MPASEITETLSKVEIKPLDLTAVITLAVTVVAGLVVIKIVQKMIRRLLGKTKLDQRVQKYVVSGVKLALYLILVIAVLDQLGINPSSLVALLSVSALALALAAWMPLFGAGLGWLLPAAAGLLVGMFIKTNRS